MRLADLREIVVDLEVDAGGEEREAFEHTLDVRVFALVGLELQPGGDLGILLGKLDAPFSGCKSARARSRPGGRHAWGWSLVKTTRRGRGVIEARRRCPGVLLARATSIESSFYTMAGSVAFNGVQGGSFQIFAGVSC